MLDRGSPWDWQHDGRSLQQPSERYPGGARTVSLRDAAKHFSSNSACAQWEPRNKGNSIALTIIHHVVPFAVRKAIAVLHGNDRDNSAGSLDVFLRNVGQRDQANLAFVSQLSQSFHRCLKRDDGVGNMQLINVDTVQAQSLETSLNRLAKMRGSCIVGPLIWAGTVPASLGGNYKAGRVRKQRFGNQFLAYIWTVRVRSIDEIDIKLHGSTKNGQSCFAIFRRPPDAFAGKAHSAEAETMHGNFPAERNIRSHICRKFFLVHD